MGTPEFIRDLRRHIGGDLLFLPGVTAVVFDEAGRVLLARRADTGQWALIGGIAEPGEQPAQTAVREVLEETAVVCVPERVVLVQTMAPVRYPNGDVCQFVDTTLRCRATGGRARVADEESLEVAWFPTHGLPPLATSALERIDRSLTEGPAWFEAPGAPSASEGTDADVVRGAP